MGCDIHLKLEMRQIKNGYICQTTHCEDEIVEVEPNAYSRCWHPVELTYNDCWGDRVYGMFAKLADVRNYFIRKIVPIPQRGFPNDACENTKYAYAYTVIPDDDFTKNVDYYSSAHYDYISESEANKWLEEGISVELPSEKSIHRRISSPDFHSPNWCTTKEMEEAIKDIFWNEEKQVWTGSYIEWFALLGAMKGIEQNGVYECRAVFWFDN